jgi:pimeloyl-ACP methyl ester carboxylesterase
MIAAMPNISHSIPGLRLTDHFFDIPLDHEQPYGESIEVYAREVTSTGPAAEKLPWLAFFQGGPGMASPRPLTHSGWIKRAVRDYRVLLLDQRGTGRSTPATFQTLARLGTPQGMAAYLKHFRADSIVRDAEFIRRALLGEGRRWTVLGQSYGGFCVTHYLSAAPEGLEGAILTGGLAPITPAIDEIYRATYKRVITKNLRYYERYPEDAARARQIVEALGRQPVLLPSGDPLTPRRFQQLGMAFGAHDGFEQVHYLLEQAFVAGVSGPELGFTFLRGVEAAQIFETNPIYALLHEAEYCQETASNWSAERVRAEYPEFDLAPDRPVFFTGEMIYPWMFDEYRYLRPLKEAAELLAADDDWPRLYDLAALRANKVPAAAAIYYDDMYVERAFSEEAARTIRGLKPWVTNEYEHNALRADGERLLDRLLQMLQG